jgi:hypothetical protein
MLEVTMDMFSSLPPKPRVGDVFSKFFEEDQVCYTARVVQLLHRKNDVWLVQYTFGNKAFTREEEGQDLALSICCGGSPEEAKSAVRQGVCQVCNRSHARQSIQICDGCDYHFHAFCLRGSPLGVSKDQDWFCPLCLDLVKTSIEDEEEQQHDEAHLRALRGGDDDSLLSLTARAIGIKVSQI